MKLVKLLQATDVRVDRRVVDFMAAFESDEHALRVSTPRAPLFVISRRFFQFRIGYDVVLDPEDRTLVLQKRLDLCLRGGFLGVVAPAAEWQEILQRALRRIVVKVAAEHDRLGLFQFDEQGL